MPGNQVSFALRNRFFSHRRDKWTDSKRNNSLAQAELYITISTVFTRFEFQLYETDRTDVEMAHAYLVPYPKWDSKGVRATVRPLR